MSKKIIEPVIDNKYIYSINQDDYKYLLDNEEVKRIINSVPKNLNEIEIAYYLYLSVIELCKSDPYFYYGNLDFKINRYKDKLNDNYSGTCRSIGKFYIFLLSLFNIKAWALRKDYTDNDVHVDVLFRTNNKNFMVNIYSDLHRVKSYRKAKYFCYNFDSFISNKKILKRFQYYKYKHFINSKFGKLSSISSDYIKKMDKKFGLLRSSKLYTDDILEITKKEVTEGEFLKCLGSKHKSFEDISLSEKVDFVLNKYLCYFEGYDKLDYQDRMYLIYNVFNIFFDEDDLKNIKAYGCSRFNKLDNIESLIKINDNGKRAFFLYDSKTHKYSKLSNEDIYNYLYLLDNDNGVIVAYFSAYFPINDISYLRK